MKLIFKDLFKLITVLAFWYITLNYCFNGGYYAYYESLYYFPIHLVLTIGYYAIISVCYKMLFINDCKEDYTNLIDEIEEGKNFFKKNKIKYN